MSRWHWKRTCVAFSLPLTTLFHPPLEAVSIENISLFVTFLLQERLSFIFGVGLVKLERAGYRGSRG